jgi:crossover junction endodeoxyribonuclease RuvC
MPRILGIDPGLVACGWGIIDFDPAQGNRISHVAHGVISPNPKDDMAARLHQLHMGLSEVIVAHSPDIAGIEETYVNTNSGSSLKLSQARGASLLSLAIGSLPVEEFAARTIKKTVSGSGKADKEQMIAMLGFIMPTAQVTNEHAADALAVAITCAYHTKFKRGEDAYTCIQATKSRS